MMLFSQKNSTQRDETRTKIMSSRPLKNSAYDTKEPTPSHVRAGPVPPPSTGEFVNVGYENWVKTRDEWKTATKGGQARRRPESKQLDIEEILDRIFNAKDGNMVLPEPVPLGKMIDILQDVWESDGLYD
jgi:hypothetical protein